ncbi:MAG: hypothetical protein JO142_16030 [Burkholderiales bacterium]|nr:hypothetical protein [Burkholderiales bacterium]
MIARLFVGKTVDETQQTIATTLARLGTESNVVVLDALHTLVQESQPMLESTAEARKLIESLAPAVSEWSDKALAELATGDDNPVRRDLIGKRLNLLANKMADISLDQAQAVANERRGEPGRPGRLAYWSGNYFRWLGLSHTARALLDADFHLPWRSVSQLFLALVAHGAWPVAISNASREPGRTLAYLLLTADAFPMVGESGVASASRVCQHVAHSCMLAADFHRGTPIVLPPGAGEPQREVGWGGPSRESPALCYGLDDAAAKVLQLADMARTGHQPVWLRDTPDVEMLLRAIAASWTEGPRRARNPALLRRQQTLAGFGFLRVRGLLAQKGARLPNQDPLIGPINLEDADERGISFMLAGANAGLLDSGLMAIAITRRGWWLAQPCRMERIGDDWFVAARWLGQEAEAIRLVGEVDGDSWRAIYVHPGPANDYNGGILVETDHLRLDQPYKADLGDTALTLQLGTMRCLGPGNWYYTATV